MTDVIQLNEEDDTFKELKKQWFAEAHEMTLENLPEFLRKLSEDYKHDYGTICHAMTASAVATAWAMNKIDQGGITGFQAGFIMWGFIREWQYSTNEIGLRLLDFDNLLYPQYADKFANTISPKQHQKLQEKAASLLAEKDQVTPAVREHWEALSKGALPFDFVVREG